MKKLGRFTFPASKSLRIAGNRRTLAKKEPPRVCRRLHFLKGWGHGEYGTTIFWETLRQDPRLLCFDEPFNRNLIDLPTEHRKRTRLEFIRLLSEDPERFWDTFAPIDPSEELHTALSDRQREYLRFILSRSERVVIDSTRLSFKLRALREVAPDARVIHLYRAPEAFASSHLRPTGQGWTDAIRTRWKSRSFFTRVSDYSNWSVERIIGSSTLRPFGLALREAGIDPEAIYSAPAVARLLAYWRLHYDQMEIHGPSQFQEQFRSVSFEEFCRHPDRAMRDLYDWLEMDHVDLDFSRIKPAAPPHSPHDPRWQVARSLAGIQTRS